MSTTVQVRASFLTDVGRVRERNEDACFAGEHVFAVADGLGGHRAGEVASDLALGSVRALDAVEPRVAAKGVADAVRKGNRAVHDRAETDDSLRGMGTTMTAVVIAGNTAHIAHVGDSRCYLIRGGQITQLSRDHTLVARMVSEGRLTPEQAEAHPQRSVLTRALGADKEVDVDESRITMVDGDRLLLCSDGLTGMLGNDEIRDYVADGSDLDEICRRLVDAANDHGGQDNITVVVVDISDPAHPASKPHRARPKSERRRFPWRLVVWLLIVGALIGGGYAGVRAWTDRSYYVGFNGNDVAIYRGLPVSFAGVRLSHVQEATPIQKSDVVPYFRPRLEDGIRVPSLAKARELIAASVDPTGNAQTATIPLTPAAQARLHPTPTPSPTPKAKR
ncbi:MAG TPA: Stp1/IreP family PP2C-type Ser/Thr phosphatase [Actinomycetota bacterium]|nr:Stp1/IreP family PP2C-type Ser/Thr phosphatase [Actinomycetota bacterium]